MSLTKQNIANALVKKTNLTQTQALVLTNQFFEQIIETLSKGEDVKLSSFGNFVVRKKSQRPGRNPKLEKRSSLAPERWSPLRLVQS